jgi:hypothetical protein
MVYDLTFFHTLNDLSSLHHIKFSVLIPSFKIHLFFFFHFAFFLLHSTPNMNGYREENSFCYFHPNQVAIGVCPLCLNERLLILASNQGYLSSARSSRRAQSSMYKKPPIILPKIFALGSFLSRLEFRHWKSDKHDHDASTSQEGIALITLLNYYHHCICC